MAATEYRNDISLSIKAIEALPSSIDAASPGQASFSKHGDLSLSLCRPKYISINAIACRPIAAAPSVSTLPDNLNAILPIAS